MKNIILTIFILVTKISFSQNEKRVSYVSCENDTLVLPKNELGIQLFVSWLNVKESERPVILFASESLIDKMNSDKFINYSIKKDDDVIVSENVYELTMD